MICIIVFLAKRNIYTQNILDNAFSEFTKIIKTFQGKVSDVCAKMKSEERTKKGSGGVKSDFIIPAEAIREIIKDLKEILNKLGDQTNTENIIRRRCNHLHRNANNIKEFFKQNEE